jgi:general L-amino acid transport system substrate-binding protein
MEGLDVDFCKAVAGGVLGDASKVKFITVTDKSRFDAVLTGQVDVAFAHTTIKPARESSIAIDFLPINFYDGTGLMVKADAGIKAFTDLDGATICTTQGKLEPSAAAALLGPEFLVRHQQGLRFQSEQGIEEKMSRATHIIWTTGGSFVPEEQFQAFLQHAETLS